MKKAFMNWSGGKDSALALWRVLQVGQFDVQTLLTTFSDASGRVSMHGVRQELLDQQAQRLGLPLVKLHLPEQTPVADYQKQTEAVLRPLADGGVTHSIFGDIFLEDLRQWREEQLSRVGLTGVFPLWKVPSSDLLREFWDAGFGAIVVSVDAQKLAASFCGRVLDAAFVADLPPGVDPCGENGEFHTFVYQAPFFAEPIQFTVGETITKDYSYKTKDGDRITSTYCFTDLRV